MRIIVTEIGPNDEWRAECFRDRPLPIGLIGEYVPVRRHGDTRTRTEPTRIGVITVSLRGGWKAFAVRPEPLSCLLIFGDAAPGGLDGCVRFAQAKYRVIEDERGDAT